MLVGISMVEVLELETRCHRDTMMAISKSEKRKKRMGYVKRSWLYQMYLILLYCVKRGIKNVKGEKNKTD